MTEIDKGDYRTVVHMSPDVEAGVRNIRAYMEDNSITKINDETVKKIAEALNLTELKVNRYITLIPYLKDQVYYIDTGENAEYIYSNNDNNGIIRQSNVAVSESAEDVYMGIESDRNVAKILSFIPPEDREFGFDMIGLDEKAKNPTDLGRIYKMTRYKAKKKCNDISAELMKHIS